MIFRQRLLSTDVLPHDSSESTTSSPIMPHHPRYKHHVAHVFTQTDYSYTNRMTIETKTSFKQQQLEWLPILTEENIQRLGQNHSSKNLSILQRKFLPIYLQVNESNEFYPLLANRSPDQLSSLEQRIRQVNRFDPKFFEQLLLSSNEKLPLNVKQYLDEYACQWNSHQTILIINLHRLFYLLSQFTLKDYFTKQEEQPTKSYELSIEEWFLILEYYLQMDGICFFMKTCTFRHSTLRYTGEGIFALKSPEACYGMKQCQDRSCRFCYERLDLTKRFECAMNFSDQQIHRFVNGYQVYLNCNVTCTTSNLIYALTCPCHQYDFVGRCQVPFRDRMMQHRMRGCRLMSNFFLGSVVAQRLQCDYEPDPLIPNSHRKLYQHSIQCSVALEIFLKCHPRYWCWVPMTREQILKDDAHLTPEHKNRLSQWEEAKDFFETEPNEYQRDLSLVRWCVNHVPTPPLHYGFSLRQKLEQYEFFQDRVDRFPSRFLDLYNATIVMALPEDASDAVRHIIQSLLVIYTEPKLVVTTTDAENISDIYPDTEIWCEHLIHPRLS